MIAGTFGSWRPASVPSKRRWYAMEYASGIRQRSSRDLRHAPLVHEIDDKRCDVAFAQPGEFCLFVHTDPCQEHAKIVHRQQKPVVRIAAQPAGAVWSASAIAPPAAASSQRIPTAARCESPMATSRCDVWSRPPCDARRPDRSRVAVTSVVSKNRDQQQQHRHRITESTPACLWPYGFAKSVKHTRLSPRNKLPVSPMKIVAG